jgi:hypothetical protein
MVSQTWGCVGSAYIVIYNFLINSSFIHALSNFMGGKGKKSKMEFFCCVDEISRIIYLAKLLIPKPGSSSSSSWKHPGSRLTRAHIDQWLPR